MALTNGRGVVLELQDDCLNDTTSVASILLKAKTIAFKLELNDLSSWIEQELSGYQCSLKELPPHRKAQGYPKFFNPNYGWCPLLTDRGALGQMLKTVSLFESVSEIEHLIAGSKSGMLATSLHPVIEEEVQKQLPFRTQTTIHFPTSVAVGVLDFVRNQTLEWALSLEQQGVIGKGMSFEKEQIEQAQMVTNNIHGGNFGVLGNVSGHSEASGFVSMSGNFSTEKIEAFAKQVSEAIPALPSKDRKQVADLVLKLEEQTSDEQQAPGKVGEILGSLRTVLEGASGNLAAQGIIAGIGSLAA
ncbi:MAG: hypothetical protein ABJ242_02380 [Marinomonas sp.]